ncbi:hypothetical protein AGMMS4956_12110 [Bacteroidia bacterium]|nr:hypothetical protein AGMMS4956_12110 [Bacteroidia bacterium]
MKRLWLFFILFPLWGLGGFWGCADNAGRRFVRISGQYLLQPNGDTLLIKGTNLGNWLNPEGYMFGFKKANSARFINEMLCQAVGADFTNNFWQEFKDNYITQEDILFLKKVGCNTIRLPFHYKLFTDEDYMGLTAAQDGFARIDAVVAWCRAAGLYLILDMHDAPGGQTGDNIDDSYGYPWLFESEASQQLYCDIWQKIAAHYKNEPVILGYELFNEPIAPYFGEKVEAFNGQLEEVYKMGVAAIRKVDNNHIILLGGAQWNSNFRPFTDWTFDNKIMYTCHRYGGEPTAEAIAHFIHFRDSTNLPMYMGEIGHNTNEWMAAFVQTMADNNIGWTFWPYKKMGGSSFVGITPPANWDSIVAFSEASRATYQEIREARPSQETARQALLDFLEACRFKNNTVHTDYVNALFR